MNSSGSPSSRSAASSHSIRICRARRGGGGAARIARRPSASLQRTARAPRDAARGGAVGAAAACESDVAPWSKSARGAAPAFARVNSFLSALCGRLKERRGLSQQRPETAITRRHYSRHPSGYPAPGFLCPILKMDILFCVESEHYRI